MSDHSITSLIEKMEGAEAGSVELDARIYSHLNCTLMPRRADYKPRRRWPDGSVTLQRKVTTSLDAALAAAERVLPGWTWEITIDGCGSVQGAPEMWPEGLAAPDRDGVYVTAQTPALALCAAILRAQSEARV